MVVGRLLSHICGLVDGRGFAVASNNFARIRNSHFDLSLVNRLREANCEVRTGTLQKSTHCNRI